MPTVPVVHTTEPSGFQLVPPCPTPSGYWLRSNYDPRLPPWLSPFPNGCPPVGIRAGPDPIVCPGMPTVPVVHTTEPSGFQLVPPCPTPSGYWTWRYKLE